MLFLPFDHHPRQFPQWGRIARQTLQSLAGGFAQLMGGLARGLRSHARQPRSFCRAGRRCRRLCPTAWNPRWRSAGHPQFERQPRLRAVNRHCAASGFICASAAMAPMRTAAWIRSPVLCRWMNSSCRVGRPGLPPVYPPPGRQSRRGCRRLGPVPGWLIGVIRGGAAVSATIRRPGSAGRHRPVWHWFTRTPRERGGLAGVAGRCPWPADRHG